MRIFLRLFLILIAATSLTTAAYSGYKISHYKTHVLPNTRMGGLDVSNLTETELAAAAAKISNDYSTHQFAVVLDDATTPATTTVTAADLGVQFASEGAASKVWQHGHEGSFFTRVAELATSYWSGTTTPITYTVDSAAMDSGIARLIDPLIIQATPAKLVVADGEVTISDAIDGKKVTAEELKAKLLPVISLSNETSATQIRVNTQPVASAVTRESLSAVASQLQSLGDLSLTLKVGDLQLKPAKADILSWYAPVQDESQSVALGVDESIVSTYLKAKAKKIDLDKSLPIMVKELRSQSVKASTATAKLGNSTLSLVAKVDPNVVTPGNYELNRFEDKYVEVNLAEQKLYAIEGGNLVKVYRVSTGKWSTPTPKGTFTIASKYPRAYSSSFGLYMPNWMNFVGTDVDGNDLPTGSYGLHELPEWPNGYKEGAAHIGTAVSHGCVRLGVGDAAEMYAWMPIGAHVVIH